VVSPPVQMNADLSTTARALSFSFALSTKPTTSLMCKRLLLLAPSVIGSRIQEGFVAPGPIANGPSASVQGYLCHLFPFARAWVCFLKFSRWALSMLPHFTGLAVACAPGRDDRACCLLPPS